jgi:16S rRNA processing protein RimM
MVDNMESNDMPVTMARIGKPHGLKGWLRIHSFTEPQSNIGNYRLFSIKSDSTLTEIEMDQLKQQGKALIAHFKGYDQPEQAQELVGLELQISNAELPVLQGGEYYWYQLQGLNIINRQGENLGVVTRLMETGANDVLVVSPSDASIDQIERLIPYLTDTVVKNINLENGLVEVDWGADYLQ